jgi:alanine racemase
VTTSGAAVESGTARAVAVIDLGAIERNCGLLRSKLAPGTELCAVVKAAGYGHGAVESARAALAGGASRLAVATGEEAAELRAALPDVSILTMGALTPAELEIALGAGSEVTLWRPEFLPVIAQRAAALGVRPRIHVKHDSGMGRLGARDSRTVGELVRAVAADDRLELTALWSHFATADEPGSAFFDEQLANFSELATALRGEHPELRLHAANSAATLRDPASHFDMVRCGIAVYGMDPFHRDPADHGLEPALELTSYVAAVKRCLPGQSAGYGRLFVAERETWIGTIPIGYGDGVRRGLTNNADVLVDGRRVPLVGTVSMDNITVDLGPDPPPADAEAVLIGTRGGERILAEELAARLGTINYEITCGISARVPREHHR